MRDSPRAYWIAEHVAEDGEEMAVLLNRETFETALLHMSMAPVMAMVTAAGHPPLYERAEGGGGGRLHDQVEMIGYEAEAEDFDRICRFRGGEQVEERAAVAVLVEDRGTAIPAIEHVVGISGHLSAWNSRYGWIRGHAKRESGGMEK